MPPIKDQFRGGGVQRSSFANRLAQFQGAVGPVDVSQDQNVMRRQGKAQSQAQRAASQGALQFQRSTGLGAGSAGGAAQAALLRSLGASQGFDAAENIGQEEQRYQTQLAQEGKKNDLAALQSGAQYDLGEQANRLTADSLNLRDIEGRRSDAFGRDQLGENQRQFNENMGFNRDQFGEDTRRYNQNFGEDARRYDQNFGEGQRQFNVNSGQSQQQIDNQNAQFGVTSGQSQQQINNQASQFGQSLAQNQNQFQQQQDLANNQFEAGTLTPEELQGAGGSYGRYGGPSGSRRPSYGPVSRGAGFNPYGRR